MGGLLLIAMQLLIVQTLDGREVSVNPTQIVTISEARDDGDPTKQLTTNVHCVLTLSNGNLVTTVEDCESVRHRLQEIKP
jgi:uncharacterized protein YlzI (FlbEa/FlbD family)